MSTAISKSGFWAALRQRLPSGVAWRLLESGHWLKVDVEVEVEVGTRFELGEIANGAP